jgi:hypothetical protein
MRVLQGAPAGGRSRPRFRTRSVCTSWEVEFRRILARIDPLISRSIYGTALGLCTPRAISGLLFSLLAVPTARWRRTVVKFKRCLNLAGISLYPLHRIARAIGITGGQFLDSGDERCPKGSAALIVAHTGNRPRATVRVDAAAGLLRGHRAWNGRPFGRGLERGGFGGHLLCARRRPAARQAAATAKSGRWPGR